MLFTAVFGGYSAYADDVKEEIDNITLLGDSITYGYGLSENEHDYGYYLGEYFDAEVENLAQNGLTTDGLLEKLEQQEVIDSVENADLICFSIGGNDLLHIFLDALSQSGLSFNKDDDSEEGSGGAPDLSSLNISSDIITKFMMDYASQLAPAASNAGENIKTITEKIKQINPDAEIVIQTVYNPFDTSNEKLALLMRSFKSFTSMYLGTINAAVKEAAPNTADISLKFSEKSYLYTNIDSFDIHPNYIGHFLIAEEIIETLGITGDMTALKEAANSIPYGTFSQFPDYLKLEIDEISNGQLRRGGLEQVIERANAAAKENNTESTESAENTETTEIASEAETTETTKNEEKSKTKAVISKVFLVLGAMLIFAASVLRFVRKRKNK